MLVNDWKSLPGHSKKLKVRFKTEVRQYFSQLEMWANAQRDGRPAEYRWRPLFNAAKFGWRPLVDAEQ